jgi:hypothetical protein
MIKLLDILKEGIYGDYLFGGKDTGVTVGWYKDELEPDTPAEKELFFSLRKYAYPKKHGHSEKSLISLDDYIPILKQLKQEYPEIVDPNLSPDTYIYRGVESSEEKIEELLNNNPNKDKITAYNAVSYYVIKDLLYSSHHKISSWSLNLHTAHSFASSYKNGIIMRTTALNTNLFFNPEFTDKLNPYEEKEVFNITNPVVVDILIKIKDFKKI